MTHTFLTQHTYKSSYEINADKNTPFNVIHRHEANWHELEGDTGVFSSNKLRSSLHHTSKFVFLSTPALLITTPFDIHIV